MNGYKIAVLAYLALAAFVLVANIGKPRKATEPLAGAIALVILAGVAFAAVRA